MINWRGTGHETLGTNSPYPILATTWPNLREITRSMRVVGNERERLFVIVH